MKMNLTLTALLSCTSPNTDTAEQHHQISYPAEVLETEDLHYAASLDALRVDVSAYYFFVNEEEYCLAPLQEALSALATYDLSGTVYVPAFPTEPGKQTFADAPLHVKEWGTTYIGLNDIIFRQKTPLEAVFYDPLGDTVGEWHHRAITDYAVVAPESLYAPFMEFAAQREARPEVHVYHCHNDITKQK